jgi:hypothetical protein
VFADHSGKVEGLMDKFEKQELKDAYQRDTDGRVSDIADQVAEQFAQALEALERGDLGAAKQKYEEATAELTANRTSLRLLPTYSSLHSAYYNVRRRLEQVL